MMWIGDRGFGIKESERGRTSKKGEATHSAVLGLSSWLFLYYSNARTRDGFSSSPSRTLYGVTPSPLA
ncbi:hypothetical protein RRG08_052471 [Elysia crispata]|uniref:Uncharacterized protein n=1 Tax=Elysia crispata TaxID=231223 RepID=A0AAE1B1I0_9GAST|nr:hypothetical protein RRG08_052471 [Elysia crispata]